MSKTATPEWISRTDAMALLGYSRSTMQRRERAKRLTPFKDGPQITRYRLAEVLSLLSPEARTAYEAKVSTPTDLLTLDEIAAMERVEVRTVRGYVSEATPAERRLPSEKRGKKRLVRRADYEAWRAAAKTSADKARETYEDGGDDE